MIGPLVRSYLCIVFFGLSSIQSLSSVFCLSPISRSLYLTFLLSHLPYFKASSGTISLERCYAITVSKSEIDHQHHQHHHQHRHHDHHHHHHHHDHHHHHYRHQHQGGRQLGHNNHGDYRSAGDFRPVSRPTRLLSREHKNNAMC